MNKQEKNKRYVYFNDGKKHRLAFLEGLSAHARLAIIWGTFCFLFTSFGIYLNKSYLAKRFFLMRFVSYIVIEGGVSVGLCAVCMFFQLPATIVGKNKRTGIISTWIKVVFWLFYALSYGHLYVLDRIVRHREETAATEVFPRIWIGGRFSQDSIQNNPISAVVDLTNEINRLELSKGTELYVSQPIWDGMAPTVADVRSVVKRVVGSWDASQGGMLVHCCFGRGRSTTLLCALLVELKYHDNWRDAYRHVKKLRPFVKMNETMQDALIAYFSSRK
mmetsp:Transcript_9803/g.14460  ORF Transcript_9803/g.14460 Transcript_9803/m.14460 type:complete len:276 (+) Transcript_9803:14-841(+)